MTQRLHVRIEDNSREIAKAFGVLARDQLPFASAVTLTRLAMVGRDRVRQGMPSHFTLRNRRPQRGIQIERAEKRDWPFQKALVGTRDAFMADHALGRVRRPQRSRTLAIPTRFVVAQRTTTGKIPKRLRPPSVLRRRGAFVKRRQIMASQRGAKRNLRIFHHLRSAVNIRKRWPMQREVQQIVQARHGVIFRAEMEKAVATSKARAGVRGRG